jgi:hypothetical protein
MKCCLDVGLVCVRVCVCVRACERACVDTLKIWLLAYLGAVVRSTGEHTHSFDRSRIRNVELNLQCLNQTQ